MSSPEKRKKSQKKYESGEMGNGDEYNNPEDKEEALILKIHMIKGAITLHFDTVDKFNKWESLFLKVCGQNEKRDIKRENITS